MLPKVKINLSELLSGIAIAPPIPMTGISDDSRNIKKGNIFFACHGETYHGLNFLESVIKNGAIAVIYEKPYDLSQLKNCAIPLIGVENLSEYMGEIANRWYDFPSSVLEVIGITGTNGKTTVAWLIQQCLSLLGNKCGYIGTLGVGVKNIDKGGLTTPSCFELHKQLSIFKEMGIKYVAVEVSSHAIEQDRIAGLSFGATIFTNLSRDHLDYHGSFEAYSKIKAKLFIDIDSKIKIINCHDDFGRTLLKKINNKAISIIKGQTSVIHDEAYLSILSSKANEFGHTVYIKSTWGEKDFILPLMGEFNIENAAQVIALISAYEFDFKKILLAMEKISPPQGRMELIDASMNQNLPSVFVDFAHTPGALKAALLALRLHCKRKIWCVFGCGGDRDKGKRKLMGLIAKDYADYVVVTSDNPRNECPENIISEILLGSSDAAHTIIDRSTAINFAIKSASNQDVILIAGKGHEDYQLIENKKINFSDNLVSQKALELRLKEINK